MVKEIRPLSVVELMPLVLAMRAQAAAAAVSRREAYKRMKAAGLGAAARMSNTRARRAPAAYPQTRRRRAGSRPPSG